MRKRDNKTGKRLHLVPLILGIYGALLGLSLVTIGFSEITNGIGFVRALLGLGMTCFGLYGIWDGVCDLVKPNKKTGKPPVRQFILTDILGNKSSNVTMERLQEQISLVIEKGDGASFHIQILPSMPVKEQGKLKQVSCLYQSVYENQIVLIAFLENPDGSYRICQKNIGFDEAKEWFQQLLSDNLDFTGWENINMAAKEDTKPEGADHSRSLLVNQDGLMTYWHRLLVIWGESWHDVHKFFSARDVELAVEGIHDGKYQKVVLEWGIEALHLFPSLKNELLVVWCTNITEKGNVRYLARTGTVNQAKFWLNRYLNEGFSNEMSGWDDITDQIEKGKKKGEKKYGKLF